MNKSGRGFQEVFLSTILQEQPSHLDAFPIYKEAIKQVNMRTSNILALECHNSAIFQPMLQNTSMMISIFIPLPEPNHISM